MAFLPQFSLTSFKLHAVLMATEDKLVDKYPTSSVRKICMGVLSKESAEGPSAPWQSPSPSSKNLMKSGHSI